MKKAGFAVMLLVMLFTLLFATTAGAVTDGELDGNGHPQVALLVMDL